MIRRFAAAAIVIAIAAPGLPAQSPPEQRVTWHDELLAADRAAADSALASGLGAALARAAASDLVLLYPGAPIVAGRETAVQLIGAQEALRPLRIKWVPLYAEVSGDGTFGVSYGVTAIAAGAGTAGPPLRMGKYLSAWRRGPEGWRIVAHAQLGLLPNSAFISPPGLRAAGNAIPASGAVADFARADSTFAALAGRDGAATAFATWASTDAVVFPGTGDLVRGTEAIRRLMTERTPAAWRWWPVVGGASAAGDLGFTVGEAVITPPGGSPGYTKYLTLWRREGDGRIRFLSDGGNGRPAQ